MLSHRYNIFNKLETKRFVYRKVLKIMFKIIHTFLKTLYRSWKTQSWMRSCCSLRTVPRNSLLRYYGLTNRVGPDMFSPCYWESSEKKSVLGPFPGIQASPCSHFSFAFQGHCDINTLRATQNLTTKIPHTKTVH